MHLRSSSRVEHICHRLEFDLLDHFERSLLRQVHFPGVERVLCPCTLRRYDVNMLSIGIDRLTYQRNYDLSRETKRSTGRWNRNPLPSGITALHLQHLGKGQSNWLTWGRRKDSTLTESNRCDSADFESVLRWCLIGSCCCTYNN